MVLDIGRALRTGLDDLRSEAGIAVVTVLVVFQLGYGVVLDSFRQRLVGLVYSDSAPGQPGIEVVRPAEMGALSVEMSLPILVGLALVGIVLNEVIRFWAIRRFAGGSALRANDAGQRLRVLLAVGGGFAIVLFALQQLLPILGLVWGLDTMSAFSQAGMVLSLLLVGVAVYLRQEIALNDGSVRQTLRNSVVRFLQEPVPILGLLVLLGVVGFAAGIPQMVTMALSDAGTVAGVPLRTAGQVVGVALMAVVQTLSIAAITDAYLQVRADAGGL